jgi:hypothetical protein
MTPGHGQQPKRSSAAIGVPSASQPDPTCIELWLLPPLREAMVQTAAFHESNTLRGMGRAVAIA